MKNTPLPPLKKEDLRVTKTKSALQEAFFKLLSEKIFNEITVNELCTLAGVRRATFYKHFCDKYDFLSKTTSMLREEFDRNMCKLGKPEFTVEYYVEYVHALMDFLIRHDTAVNMILRSEARHSLINIIVEQNFKDTKIRLCRNASEGNSLPADADTLAAIITGGVGQALYKWYESGKKTSAVELADGIIKVIKKILE